mmetsp:Transcript_82576/g.230259  ORF Transcript_82576/g.230259 Transcript_82576/m.230259 type:complete len:206 (-) Transcript_82576:1-618(-)
MYWDPWPVNKKATRFAFGAGDLEPLAVCITTLPFVPPKPKEETEAVTAPVVTALIAIFSVGKRALKLAMSSATWSFNTRKWRLGGAERLPKTSTSFSIPTMPAPPSKWPTFVFTAPRSNALLRPGLSTACNAPNSMGSPSSVPVPWVSNMSRTSGATWASLKAVRTTACCEGPFGEVRFELRPSWLRALPRSSATPGRSASRSKT